MLTKALRVALAILVRGSQVGRVAHASNLARAAGSRPAAVSPAASDTCVLAGRLARVVVEAHPGLAPVPARREHLAKCRRARETPLAELVEQHVADRPERVEADEVGERERPHRM